MDNKSGVDRGQGSDHEVKTLAFSLGTFSAEEWQDIFDVYRNPSSCCIGWSEEGGNSYGN